MSDEVLERLRAEREEAGRLYHDAMTALHVALQAIPEPLSPPPEFDTHQLATLNELWNILPEDPTGGATGWRKRAVRLVWPLVRRVVGPLFRPQLTFNAALVEHVNRNVWGHHDARLALGRAVAVLRALQPFRATLVAALQQITPFEVAKITESMTAREQRFDAKVRSLTAAHEEIRTELGALHRTSLALRDEIERVLASGAGGAVPLGAPTQPVPAAAGREAAISLGERLASHKYIGFEDTFRGSQADIRARMAEYVPLFAGACDVLDLGCGRGEFLELLREAGVRARGVDTNHAMVEHCRTQGLEVVEADGLAYLDSLADGALGGLFAAQVVEHLEPAVLVGVLDAASRKLRPGARIVLETINPSCWFAFFEAYIRDITHVQPVHPETLKYLLQASGFHRVEIRFQVPYPEAEKLQAVPVPRPSASDSEERQMLIDLALTFNANIERINGLMFTYLDYAAVGERL
jgi:SAM-dependent methyltransferase